MRASLAWREPATRCGGHGKTRVAQEEGTDLQIEVQRACREMVSDSVLVAGTAGEGTRGWQRALGTGLGPASPRNCCFLIS